MHSLLTSVSRIYRMVPPGMTVRKSVRVVFLRFGKCDLNRFALFDRLSRTCFLPSARASTVSASSSSASSPNATSETACAWEVFLQN